ncbi:transcriptional regulator family: Centromere protein B DNA-binding region [Penicillium lagena]|uniref:transcriptional regulator family: Centromere protein B DNA-binding region n=1 Tax=Penicillium lagena TaxID=94218 RepID=UPI0025415E0A|nr:transcriptional regulator family: Centromere protein B DNA-binding region [Penicillium lagena]KAJ5602026.1 transcriptional regulator family: Centromere protein B DNA-binding region [Penicillium lagena]
MQNSVNHSAKMPTARRARKGISDAQKQALRVYASETHPKPSQKTCVEWFRSQFGRLIDRATVSKIVSSKY